MWRGPYMRKTDLYTINGKNRPLPAAKGFDQGQFDGAMEVIVAAREDLMSFL